MSIQLMSVRPQAALLAVVRSVLPVTGADFTMIVTNSGYLDTQGFSVILYHSTYDRTLVDKKNAAMESRWRHCSFLVADFSSVTVSVMRPLSSHVGPLERGVHRTLTFGGSLVAHSEI